MEHTGLAVVLDERWAQITTVDALLDALERGDAASAERLLRAPGIHAALNAESWIRLEVLSCMGSARLPDVEDEAFSRIRMEPEIARARFGRGQTLLHGAARAWHVTFARLLLDLGADPDAADRAGHPPLYYAGNGHPRPIGASDADADALVALFAAHGADLNRAEGVKRCTPLHMAARRGHAALAEALVARGAEVEARDTNGETPLRRAVNCRHALVARVLIEAGADPRSRCRRGKSPIDAARTEEMRAILAASI